MPSATAAPSAAPSPARGIQCREIDDEFEGGSDGSADGGTPPLALAEGATCFAARRLISVWAARRVSASG